MDAKESKRIGGYMTATTPERKILQKLIKLLPSKDCDVCNGLGGWTSETFTTAGMKWVVCDKCHGLPETELVDSIMALLSTELSAQATEILGEVENKKAVSVAIYGNMPAPHDETYKTGYNKAIDDVLALLRSKWEGK